jgi:hypothetical protein
MFEDAIIGKQVLHVINYIKIKRAEAFSKVSKDL